MAWTEAQYAAHLARMATAQPGATERHQKHESEARQHAEILDGCRRLGWVVVHSRMDRTTTTAVGIPDFVIAVEGGVTLWAEVKVNGRKATPEQLGVIARLKKLGHVAGIVSDFGGILAMKIQAKEK